jgi:hypothetical protein
MHKGFKCLEISSGRVYISRDVVFDETKFPFSKLHTNVGARLREEISLLPLNLLNIPESEQLGDHMANLPDESNVSGGSFDENRVPNASNMDVGATGQENAGFGVDFGADPADQRQARADPPRDRRRISLGPHFGLLRRMQRARTNYHAPRSLRLTRLHAWGRQCRSPMNQVLPRRSVPHMPCLQLHKKPLTLDSLHRLHLLLIRLQLKQGLTQDCKEKVYTDGTIKYSFFAASGEPCNLDEALTDKNWKDAMDSEYKALV